MLAWIVTGLEKLAVCQPEAVSPVKVAVARRVPVLLQRWPTWVPVLPSPLKKRMPVMVPATRERNLTPNSTPFASGAGFTSGNDGGDFQMLVGATVLPVVNDQVTGLDRIVRHILPPR